MPIFPELEKAFNDAFDLAAPGEIFCCPQYAPGSAGMLYRKPILAAIRRAGVEPWQKLFINLRATRASELAEKFPAHVCAGWLGHSPAVAVKHYLMMTEDHFKRALEPEEKAIQKAIQQGREMPEMARNASGAAETKSGQNPVFKPFQADSQNFAPTYKDLVTLTGLEPVLRP